MTKKIYKVGEDRKNYYGVRFRPPSQFEEYATPDHAKNVSQSVSKGSKVVMGKTESGTWLVQSVLIKKKYHSKRDARRLARRIRRKLEG